MSNTKNVEFDLFRPYFLTNEEENPVERRYNLIPLLEHISNNPLSETKHRIYGDHHMFHKCKYHQESKIWEMQVLHLREEVLPGIADEDGSYELIKLDENEYPAESTTMIYDENTSIFYMQRNIYGSSVRAVQGLLQLISPEGVLVTLKTIEEKTAMRRVNRVNKIRKVILTVDSQELSEEENNSSLGRIISNYRRYEGNIVTVTLSVGRRRNTALNREETLKLINEAYGCSATENLKVGVKESSDSYVETIDLLDDRVKFIRKMSYSREDPITHDRLYFLCLHEIKNRN